VFLDLMFAHRADLQYGGKEKVGATLFIDSPYWNRWEGSASRFAFTINGGGAELTSASL
jgi:hypothetical protein